MKNKKGFTLVELLVVIVLIGVLIIIAISSGLAISKKIKRNIFDTKIETIERAAIIFGQNHNEILKTTNETCEINGRNYKCIKKNINTLLINNAIKEDKIEYNRKVIINPVSEKEINQCGVYIYLKNNRVYAKYDDTKIDCSKDAEPEQSNPAFLLKRESHYSTENYYEYKTKIIEIKFVNHTNYGESFKQWNVADTRNGAADRIIAWLEEIENNKYILYIGSKERIYAPTNSEFLFRDFINLEKISFDNFDTSKVTTMNQMFFECRNLKSIDLSNFNTNSVTNMSSMFWRCFKLIKLDLSNFNTSSVTNMSSMFWWCTELINLDLSNFNTNSVTNMSTMFNGCSALKILDLSNFNTKNVNIYNMNDMFKFSTNLAIIYLNDADSRTLLSSYIPAGASFYTK